MIIQKHTTNIFTMSTPKLDQLFPHAKFPFICNAPMAGIATPQLAAEVTKAGGIGTLTHVYHVRVSIRMDSHG